MTAVSFRHGWASNSTALLHTVPATHEVEFYTCCTYTWRYTLIQKSTTLAELSLPRLVLTQEQLFCTSRKNTRTAAVFRIHLKDGLCRGHELWHNWTVRAPEASIPNTAMLRWLTGRSCQTFEINSNKAGEIRIRKHWGSFVQLMLQWKSSEYYVYTT